MEGRRYQSGVGLMAEPRYDAKGPVIRWLDYGYEGWKPHSFDTIRDALEWPGYGSPYVITRLAVYEVADKTEATS